MLSWIILREWYLRILDLKIKSTKSQNSKLIILCSWATSTWILYRKDTLEAFIKLSQAILKINCLNTKGNMILILEISNKPSITSEYEYLKWLCIDCCFRSWTEMESIKQCWDCSISMNLHFQWIPAANTLIKLSNKQIMREKTLKASKEVQPEKR
jgi:hypothetical protein